MSSVELSVVVPVFNEAQTIEALVERLFPVLKQVTDAFEVIFVNDGSRDATLKRVQELAAKDSRIAYIDFSRNFGHQVAVTAGLDHASGRSVVIIDADLQDPPELIPQMVDKMREENLEVVYARRRRRRGESFFKRMTARLFYRLLNRWASIDIPLDTGDFRVMDHKVVEVLRQMPEKHKFLRGQISWIGFRQSYVEYDRDPRFAGETKYPLKKMLRFAMDGITGFSTVPLRIVTWMGFASSLLAFLLILWVLVVKIFGKSFGQAVQIGWASQMIVTLFIGGIQLIGIGILGEYIGRITDNIRDRPLYIIRERSPKLREHKPVHGAAPAEDFS